MSPPRSVMMPGPYVLFWLDGPLARYAGVSPNDAIGEPIQANWKWVSELLDDGVGVKVITWREPSLVMAWMDTAKLYTRFVSHRNFEVVNLLPAGMPLYVVGPESRNPVPRLTYYPPEAHEKPRG